MCISTQFYIVLFPFFSQESLPGSTVEAEKDSISLQPLPDRAEADSNPTSHLPLPDRAPVDNSPNSHLPLPASTMQADADSLLPKDWSNYPKSIKDLDLIDRKRMYEKKRERKFLPRWLDSYRWLIYDAGSKKMYCRYCMRHRPDGPGTFVKGCPTLRSTTLQIHEQSHEHQLASIAEYMGPGVEMPPSGIDAQTIKDEFEDAEITPPTEPSALNMLSIATSVHSPSPSDSDCAT